MDRLNRRNVLAATGMAPMIMSAPAAHAQSTPLGFATTADHIRAFLKLHVSLKSETVYHFYIGTLEAMVPGKEVTNLVSSTTIIRRTVDARPEGHHISIWEATVYHRPGETEPLDEFVNPLNGRTVRPFHQREGRGEALWTDTGPRILRNGEWTARPSADGKPFTFNWSQAGERIWMSRYSSGVYVKNPLDPAKWPLEASGPDLIYSEKTTNSGLIREVADPAVLNASATYSLSSVILWWPWLLMGQTPGHLVWNTNGVKLSSLDQIPTDTRKMMEKVHPVMFRSGEPWDGRISLWTEYPKTRQPAT